MTTSIDVTNPMFFGRGGARPGVMSVQDDIRHSEWLVELAAGESVYSLDVNMETSTLAFGTRAGRIYLRQWSDGNSTACQERLQGAPVLSVCWLGRSLLCSSDFSGQCLLWPIASGEQPRFLETDGRTVCALAKMSDGQFIGLASDGCMLFWSLPQGELLKCIEGPRPCSKIGLVNLRHWSRRHLLIYPTEDGQLCSYRPDAMQCECVEAHQGGLYVVLPAEKRLITVGREDGLIKIWHDLTSAPACRIEIPWSAGFVAGWATEPDGRSILLIDEEGIAGVFSLTDTSVTLVSQLPGDDFRAVVGKSPDELARCRRQSVEAKARGLIAQAAESIGQGRSEGLESLAAELTSLNYCEAALGIRAQAARLQDDPLKELKIRHELIHMLNGDYTAFRDSVARYAVLLERFWRLASAWSIYRELDDEPDGHGRYRWLEQAAEIVAGEPYIIEPDEPLLDVVRAACTLDTAFSGTWVLTCSRAMTLPPEVSAVDDFLGKYELLRQGPGYEKAPSASCRTIRWISRNDIKETTIINFKAVPPTSNAHIETILRFGHCGNMITLTPALLLKAAGPAESVQEHNQKLIHMLEQIQREGFANTEQWDLQRLVTLAVRRLWTESAWRRQGGKEISRE
ncbi:MAG: WD40 repeat domain-containing protein [Planctomycetota bacterium]|jgi:hypothetical protein